MIKNILPAFNKILTISVFTVCLAIICYYFIDRPVAVWAYNNSRIHPWHAWWEIPTHLEPLYYFISPWVIVFLIIKLAKSNSYRNCNINEGNKIVFLMVMALWLSLLISEEMRILFGRSWPSTWFHGNLSYIKDGVYGFTWLQTAHEYKSFPSGHATLTFACMMALWWQTQNKFLRVFAILNCFLVCIGLILMCYHWVSDVIIGALVGSVCAYIILYGYQCIQYAQCSKE